MRILVAHNVPRSRTTGMSRIMECTHDELEREGHCVEYFCSDDVSSPLAKGRLGRAGFPFALVQFLRRQSRMGKTFDIVNVHEPSGAAIALLRNALGGAKLVVTSHGVEERAWRQGLGTDADPHEKPSLKTRIVYPSTALWQANFALRRADHVFCLNEEDREYLIRRFARRAEDITRIFPAADPLYGMKAAARDYGTANKILFAGTWIVRKGILPLAEALASLMSRYSDLEFVALNPGVPSASVLEHFPWQLRDRVCCLKTSQESETVKAFEDADIFVLPSVFEGTPLTLMEAMWSGLSIVTTNTCGMKDVIRNEENGLLVPMRDAELLEDAIERLVTNAHLRRSLGQRAYQEASVKFQWKNSAKIALEGYSRALIQ